MQPSSAGSGPDRGSNLRRYGPIIAIVVVIAIVAVVVLVASGSDDKKTASTASGSTSSQASGLPEGAIPFSQKGSHPEATFPSTCDTSTGKVAIPFFYAPECFANVADNGGATANGVTKDTVTVVVYLSPDTDPILDFITAPIHNDDTADQIQATYEGFTDLFNQYYQTYNRKVVLKFLHGSGPSDDEVAARADAVKATEELGAFAVWGGPVLAPAWTEEIKAHNVICLGCPDIEDPKPVVFPITASGDQTRTHLAEYIIKKLKDKPAQFAGDDAFKSKTRTFGQIYINTAGSSADADAAAFKQRLSDGGVTIDQVPYRLDDLIANPGVATNVISKLKADGVTTVVVNTDPIAPKSFTEEATKQNYFPEWVYGGSALVDTNAFGRTYDQKQWAHAFGITSLAARTTKEVADRFDLYRWFKGTEAPANDTVGVLAPQPELFFAGLQFAGPKLTVDTFRQGLFAATAPTDARTTTAVGISYGDHGIWPDTDFYGIDDFTEIWWDPNASGPDEIDNEGNGLMRFVDQGKRYRPGEWPSDLRVFDPANTSTLLDTLPTAETPKEYPSPATAAN
jgi:hypothetical protein